MPVNTKLQIRRGTALSWTNTAPILSAGEIGYETDTGLFKIGDGITTWDGLKYASFPMSGVDTKPYFGSGVYQSLLSGSGISILYNSGVSTISLADPTVQVSDITDLTANATELNYLDGSLPGSGVAGKAVVLDSNLNIANLGNINTTGTVTIGGNLIVNGNTTTVNSTITTLDDPIITLGGDTSPVSSDGKDRGVEFKYYSDSLSRIGFFGFDDSTGKFTFIPNATNTNEIFTGTKGEIDAKLDWLNILNIPIATTGINGIASFNSNDFSIDSGAVSIKTSGISNTQLEYNSITLGQTVMNLGGSYNAISGISAANPITLTYFVIDGGTP